ncbi:mucin-12-like [Anopheles maculipalpis]|uniref:mucin-12-like n=1 Tax=Anopheles maculipalpis TaxID=1496333 RepID=UPI0021591A79|nr:mucin-12-like [Anopheles maculipalpis]
MEAQFACADLSSITDEDLLRKMWQQAEDFSRKKEIRAYMYKLREQRLKEFYTSNDSSPPYFLMDNASATFGLKKSTVTGSHGDSLVDQSFESFKTKEIRDSESPTRFGNMAIPSDNSGWQIRTSEEVSEDGKTHTMRTTATTQGIKEIDGGRTAFAGKNLESHSEHYDGDESNFVHSKGDQSTTVLVEDSVTEDENGRSVSGSTHSTTTSVSRTRVVHQQQNGDSERPSKSVADAAGLSSATTVDFGDDHFSSSQKRTVTSSTSSSVLGNSASTKNTEHSTTNRMDKQTMSGKVEDERMAPKELSKDPERVREAFRLAQGSGKIIEREETMVNTTTKMITETKRLDDGTTVTTRTYEKIGHEPTSANDKLEQETLSSTTKRQQEAVGRSGRMDDSSATNDFIRQEKANQSSTSTTTKTSSQRIMVEVDAAHDSFARSLRSVSPTGSIRSVRSNATLPGRASTSPEKTQPLRTDLDTKPDYMRSTFTSERKVSGYQEQQSLPTQRSPSPRKVSETTLHTGSRSTSPTKITTAAASTAVEYEKTSQCQTHKTESEQMDYPEVDGVKARSSTKPPLVRSETYEERCRKILGMSNRPVEEDTKGESKSIFSTYDNTVTVQQSRSELREQRKKIEQEIKSMESKTMKSSTARHVTDEQDSVVEKEHASSRKPSLVTKESSTRKLSSQQTSPTRKPSPTPKESSPIRKGLAQADSSPTKAPTKEGSPSGKAPLREISPTVKEMSPTKTSLPEEDNLTARKSPTKAPSPTRVSPTKDSSPTRHSSAVIDVSSKLKSSQTETTTVRTSPTKETSPTRKPARDVSPLKNERVASPKKPFPETTTKSKATILVEQKQDGRNISVAEITILPVMEVSENVRTKTTTSRTHEKILTKQSSDTKFDRRSTMAANSRVITNKSSSDFDVKRRAAELATQSKTRSTATSPDKRRPTSGVEKPAPVKQNHITVAKIKIESMRKPNAQTKSTHATNEETTSVRSSTKRTSEQVIVSKRPVEPDTDPESSKDTGISDNSEVEETVESVIEMNVTGTSCCRHTDRKDSAPVYRTTAVTRTGKNYSRSSSDNHLRATNASANRQTTNQTTLTSKSTVSDRSANGGRKADRPVKHVATKTINLASKAVSDVNALSTTCSSTLGSDHLDNVVIDIQLAKSSREPTPNKLIPIPVSPDTEDTGKPRYPDAVLEPEDDTSASRQSRTQRVNKIPIFEEATNEYVGCEITEVDEATSQHATRITNLDRVTEDDESLLSVTEKVNKFAQEARRLQESSNSGIAEERPQPARFAVRPEYDDIDEHLKSDECLLSVSDKVTKFISTAEEVKKIRTSGPFVPENEDAPVKVSEGDECLLSVNEKVNRFANRIQRTSESREHDTFSSSGGRLQTSVGNDQLQQKMEEEEEDYVEEEEKVAEKKPQTNSVPESVSSKFAPQKSPELVKNAMRSTARHIVQDAAHEDLAQAGGSSIANRYRTSTMSKQFEKQTPATVAPCTSPIILRSTEAVKKAKEIFEKGQTVQDARQRDILNRPSIWEDRRNKQNQPQQQQTDQKPADVKLTDIGVTERKSNQAMQSVTKVERVQESETTKPASSHGRRDSGSGVRPPAYIRDTVSSKKDLFEKRISSSKMQVEYTTQTSQEATETLATTTTRRQSLKQVDTSAPSSTGRPIHAGDQSKPSYMNHTVASLEHINANQRRDSLDHGVQAHHESTTTTARNSITGSAKFGIELKRADTSNRMTTSSVQSNVTSSKRKASAGDGQPASTVASSPVIEDIFDLEMLERMLESVTGYEQRRRIRAQIRVVKKQREQQPSFVSLAGKQATVTSVKNSTTTHSTTVTNGRESSSGKRKDSSPTRSSTSTGRKQSSTTTDATDTGSKSNAIFETDTMISKQRQQHQQQQQNQEHENARNDKTNVINSSKTATVVTDRLTTKTGATDRHATTKDDRPIWATSNILKKASENTRTFKSSSVTSSSATTGTGGRKVVSSSSSYQQVKSKTDPKTTTDCITSSYGVGPTDENGLPLFGIRALKKKAAPVPAATEDTKISGTIITETLYAENGGPAVGKRSTTHYSNEPGTFSDFVRSDGGHEIFGDDGLASKQKGTGKLMAIRKTETIDAAGTHSEELEVMDGSEMRSKVVRKGSVKELTERFIHRESSGSLTQESTRTYPKAGLILRSSGHSQSSRASTPATDRCSMQSGSVDEFEQDHLEAGVTTREARSFLNDTSKIVDVRDVLQRMSNADNVTEQGDTAEDQEARALLNKFLGASVLMSGVESMVSSTGSMLSETASVPFTTATATKKVSKVSSTTTKTQTVKSSGATPSISPTKQATVDNLDDNWDEAVLKKLLESTTNYDDRRKIRARIRQVMAEKEACADIVAIVTADLQRERQLQQQSTSATASTSVTPDRPSAPAATVANGLSQGESLLLPLLQGLLLSNAAAFGYKGNTFAGNADEAAGVSSSGGSGVADGCSGSHISSSNNGKLGAVVMAASKIPPVEDSGTESGEDLRLLAAAGLHDIGNVHSSSAASAGATNGTTVNGNGGVDAIDNGLPTILGEVASALDRLQTSLQADPSGQPKVMQIDAEQRRGLLALIARLQEDLQQPDKIANLGFGNGTADSAGGLDTSQNRIRAGSSRFSSKRRTNRSNRHTVGVSREELADARRFIEEMVMMDSRHQTDQCVTSPEKAYMLQKQQSLGTVLRAEPEAVATAASVSQPQPMQNGGNPGTAPATAFAMKRPSQFVPKEMQNVQTSLDKLVLGGTGGKPAALPSPGTSQVRTKLPKDKLLIRQSISVDQDPTTTNGVGAVSDRQDSVSVKPIDLHRHKTTERITKNHHQHQPVQQQQSLPQPDLPFKKPTQTIAQRALVKKYSFNDGSSSDEDVTRQAQRKTSEATKTAEQMVLRNKITPAEQSGPTSSIVINTVQKIVNRETKPNSSEVGTKAQIVSRRQQHLNGNRVPETHKDDLSARPLNKYASKKLRMKRANTIDLPKSLSQNDTSDDVNGDPDGKLDGKQDQLGRQQSQSTHALAAARQAGMSSKYPAVTGPLVPPADVPDFKPRTENDLKFMAFLQKQNQQSRQIWSNPVREHVGSNNWTNKFDHLKSNFEQAERRDRSELPPKYGAAPKTSAMSFWKQAESGSFDEPTKAGSIKQHAKSVTPSGQSSGFKSSTNAVARVSSAGPTTTASLRSTQSMSKYGPSTSQSVSHNTSTGSPVIEARLVLPRASPGSSSMNQFSHAPASAFKPIPKKIPPASLEFKPIQQELDIVKPIPARISNATGLVKQIVATGFKETPEIKPEPIHVQSGLVRSLAAQGYQETPYVPLPKLERTPTHNVLNYKPRSDASTIAEPAPPAPWVGKRSSEVTGPAGSRVASIAATKFTANSFGHNKTSLPVQQPLTYQGSLKYAEKPLTYQQLSSSGTLPYEKRASLPDVSISHLGTFTFTDYTQPESVSTFTLNRSDSLTNPENAPLVLTSTNSVFSPTTGTVHPSAEIPNQPLINHPSQINYLTVNVDQQHQMSPHSSANDDDDEYDCDDLESIDSQEMRVVTKVMQAPQGQQATYTAAMRPTHLNDGYDASGRGSLIAQNLQSSLKKIKEKSPTPPKSRQHITTSIGEQLTVPVRRPMVAPKLEVTKPTPDHTQPPVPSHAIYNNVQPHPMHRYAEQPLTRTKSSHSLAVPSGAQLARPISADKQRTVEAYFTGQPTNQGSGYMMSRTASNQNLVMRDKSGMSATHNNIRPVSYAMGYNGGYYGSNSNHPQVEQSRSSYVPHGMTASLHSQKRHGPSYIDEPLVYHPQPHGGGLLRSRTMPHIPLGSLTLLDENNVEDAFEELMNQSFAV